MADLLLDPAKSRVRIRTFAEGLFAKLAHDIELECKKLEGRASRNDDSLTMGTATVDVPVGGGSIFEVRLREPGDYPFVTHAFADATKGGVGILRALAPGQTADSRPSTMAH